MTNLFAKGLVAGILLALPMWAVIIWAVWP